MTSPAKETPMDVALVEENKENTSPAKPVEENAPSSPVEENKENAPSSPAKPIDAPFTPMDEEKYAGMDKFERYRAKQADREREKNAWLKKVEMELKMSAPKRRPMEEDKPTAAKRLARRRSPIYREPAERRVSARNAGVRVDYSALGDDHRDPGERRSMRDRKSVRRYEPGEAGMQGQYCGMYDGQSNTKLRRGDVDPSEVFGTKMIESNRSNFRFTPPPKPQMRMYGEIPGVEVGVIFFCYEEMRWAGVHYDTCAGISTGWTDGAYSVVLNGGYDDDVDEGEHFRMSGSGGRDLKGTAANPKNLRNAPQTFDMTLTKRNLKLSNNVKSGELVRVIRGHKSKGGYAPPHGFRYDGLYTLDKFEFETGGSGFQIVMFYFTRVADQAPPPWVQPLDQQAWTDNQLDVMAAERDVKEGIEPEEEGEITVEEGEKELVIEKTATKRVSFEEDMEVEEIEVEVPSITEVAVAAPSSSTAESRQLTRRRAIGRKPLPRPPQKTVKTSTKGKKFTSECGTSSSSIVVPVQGLEVVEEEVVKRGRGRPKKEGKKATPPRRVTAKKTRPMAAEEEEKGIRPTAEEEKGTRRRSSRGK